MFNIISKGRFYIGLFIFTVRKLFTRDYLSRTVETNKGNRKAYVFYTEFKLMHFKGLSFGPFVWIYEKSRADKGLLTHELFHVRQFYEEGVKIVQVLWSKAYELKLELGAYAEQIKAGANLISMARHLSTKYSFSSDLSQKQAISLLSELVGD
jgi:hypothetical protein